MFYISSNILLGSQCNTQKRTLLLARSVLSTQRLNLPLIFHPNGMKLLSLRASGPLWTATGKEGGYECRRGESTSYTDCICTERCKWPNVLVSKPLLSSEILLTCFAQGINMLSAVGLRHQRLHTTPNLLPMLIIQQLPEYTYSSCFYDRREIRREPQPLPMGHGS